MGTISGIGGAVDGVNTVRTWTISSSADLQSFAASNTAGATGRAIGNKDWSGSYTAYGPQPVKMPGEKFTFTGSIDGTNGATGDAIVDSVEISIDIEGGGIIAHTVSFSSDGELSLGAAVAVDATVPAPYTSIGCKVELAAVAAEPQYGELANVRTVTLSFSAENPSYIDSSTAGQTKRHVGNIDLEVSIGVYVDDFADLPALNTVQSAKIYVSDTEYWEISWLMFGEASDLTVDREGAAIVGASLNAGLVVSQLIGEVQTLGEINTPDLETWWPAA